MSAAGTRRVRAGSPAPRRRALDGAGERADDRPRPAKRGGSVPGIPTHFRLFDRAVEHGVQIGQVEIEKGPYAYLGAIGPSLGDFVGPSDSGQATPDPSPYWRVWDQVFAPVFGYDARAMTPVDAV